MICNKKIKFITRILVICFIVINIMPPITIMGMQYDSVTAEYFFGELLDQLNIDISGLEKQYAYCSPQIAYLVKMGYITPYQAHVITEGYTCSTGFLIDNGFLLVKYFDRPLDMGDYDSITERISKETGLVKESFDFSKPLNYNDANNIIYKLINDRFKRIKYSTYKTKIPYKLYDFYDMTNTFQRTLHNINKLPQSCIDEFNKRVYILKIVEYTPKVHPYKEKNVLAYILYGTREIVIMKEYEDCIFHEFGHLMIRTKIINWPSVCRYLYAIEGDNACKFNGIRSDKNTEEYFCHVFGYLIQYQDDQDKQEAFKEKCPITYHFVWNILLKIEVSKKILVEMPLNINTEYEQLIKN